MFTLQAASAISQLDGMSDADKATLQNLLGDCSQPLEHRAPVTIEGNSSDTPPPINITNFLSNITNEISNHNDEYYAMVTVQNFSSTVEGDTIYNGFSNYSPGASYYENLIVSNLFVDTVTIDGTEYCYVDKDVVVDASISYSFNSATCALTLTLTLDKDPIKALEECP